ncbi:hypothetical protein O3M35_003089 [Rhynocoris fuscipes]|uniref:MADF domain-containing protein n=1 Tax=Rhynocoris fuscipes TaxID=488301 RepID=A0AAW1CIY4_9HEMI
MFVTKKKCIFGIMDPSWNHDNSQSIIKSDQEIQTDKFIQEFNFHTLPKRALQSRSRYSADLEFIGQLNNVALIQEIKKYPCLYDLDKDEYRDFNIKEHCWIRIAKKLNQDVRKIKEDWRKLRDCYRQLKQNGPTVNPLKGWYYQKEMEFLRPSLATYTDTIKILNNNINKSVEKSEIVDNDEEAARSKRFRNEQKRNMNNICNECRNENNEQNKMADNGMHINCNNDYGGCHSSSRSSVIDTELFFSSMCESTKRLPKLYQNQIKKRLFDAVLTAEHQYHVDINQQNSIQTCVFCKRNHV